MFIPHSGAFLQEGEMHYFIESIELTSGIAKIKGILEVEK
jgi:hypothetical protein